MPLTEFGKVIGKGQDQEAGQTFPSLHQSLLPVQSAPYLHFSLLAKTQKQDNMDPISALTVAAAVVQFVDFSMSIVCKTKDIYNSIDGVTMENKETETVTIRLKEMAKELQMEKPGFEKHTSPRLKSICVQCVAASDELVSRLSRLTVPDGSVWRRWKSFRQALKSVWSKEIDAMAQRLNVLRSEIDSEVLTFVRYVDLADISCHSFFPH